MSSDAILASGTPAGGGSLLRRARRMGGCYVLDGLGGVGDGAVRELLPSLPPWRRGKAEALRSAELRRGSVLAFVLLRHVLRAEWGIGEIEFEYSEHGKPSLKGHPDVFFSMSHCRDAVACAVGREPVGVDVESRGRYREGLASRVCDGEELAAIAAAADPDLLFTELWTRKEAVLKMAGEGIQAGMPSALRRHRDAELSSFAGDGWVCSVAVCPAHRCSATADSPALTATITTPTHT